jgi:hypothetical protein
LKDADLIGCEIIAMMEQKQSHNSKRKLISIKEN